jgi:AcrR family transcriptional regulator
MTIMSNTNETTPARYPRWRRRKEARPGEILAAALEEFVDRGYSATRLEDVARRAGVTKGTVYLYFTNKEDLFKAVVRESFVPELARGERAVAEFTGTSRELFRELIERWWTVLGSSRLSGIPKLMTSEAANFPDLARFYYEEVVKRGHQLIATVLQRGVDRGEFREMDIPTTVRLVMAPLMFQLVMKHSFHRCVNDNLSPPALLDRHVEVFLDGIAVHEAKRA